jgi:hypothetical protein
MTVDAYELTDSDQIKELVGVLIDCGVSFRYEKTPFTHRVWVNQEYTDHLKPIFRDLGLWFAKAEVKEVER